MQKARDCHLTEEELPIVEAAMKRDQRPGVRQRCTAIRLLHLGYKPEEVAKMQAVSIPTVYSCIKHWRKGGLEELATKPRSGRPAKADEAYEKLVAEVAEKEPEELESTSRCGQSIACVCTWPKKPGLNGASHAFERC
jgi:transposase